MSLADRCHLINSTFWAMWVYIFFFFSTDNYRLSCDITNLHDQDNEHQHIHWFKISWHRTLFSLLHWGSVGQPTNTASAHFRSTGCCLPVDASLWIQHSVQWESVLVESFYAVYRLVQRCHILMIPPPSSEVLALELELWRLYWKSSMFFLSQPIICSPASLQLYRSDWSTYFNL